MRNIDFFDAIVATPNVADLLDEDELQKIAQQVNNDYMADKSSMTDWLNRANDVIELANMKHEGKDTPWENAANVKYPIISRAVLQWASNASSEIIRQGRAIEVSVVGTDPEGQKQARADRVKDFMNWQLLVKNTDWQDSMDRSLRLLAVVGTIFRKTYFDPVTGDNCTQLCLHDEIVVPNHITSLKAARRITHIQKMDSNEIVEGMRKGVYSDIDDDILQPDSEDPEVQIHTVYEQHRYLDLDDDGYAEPYIVTILPDHQKVLRIYPRFEKRDIITNDKGKIRYIKPTHYFVDYHCIPSCDGKFMSIGFGALLQSINNTVNTGINQLIDAGTLANTQTGFLSKGLKIASKDFALGPGKLFKVDEPVDGGRISDSIHMLSFKEPSTVLFSLMGQLDQVAKELSSTTDIMSGNQLAQNAPATSVLTLVERGMKVYNDIQKRLFRALSNEYQALYDLNRKFLNPIEYLNVLDNPEATPEDFENRSYNIQTIANPELASDAQRLAQSQVLYSMINLPGMNIQAIVASVLEAANVKDIGRYVQGDMQQNAEQQQQIQQAMVQQEAALKERAQQLAEAELQLRAQKDQFDQQLKAAKLEQTAQKQKLTEGKIILDSVNENKKLDIELANIAQTHETAVTVAKIASEARNATDRERD